MRNLVIEHNCRFQFNGELFNDGDVQILDAFTFDDNHFRDAFNYADDKDIPKEHPITWGGYEGEVEVQTEGEGGNAGAEWVAITYQKTFIRTRKTYAQLLKLVPVWEAKHRLVPNLISNPYN
jgi:hypothetical protein